MNKEAAVIFLVIFILCLYQFRKKEIILIGIPTIDRDIDIAHEIYKNLIKAINNCPYVNFDIMVVTRENDKKSIAFWQERANLVTVVENYTITDRHNQDALNYKFNLLKEGAKGYDKLIILESDVVMKPDSITKMLLASDKAEVVLYPFETPWAGYPVIVDKSLQTINARDLGKDQYILGHGTGCVMLNKKIIEDNNIFFFTGKYDDIIGQDVGFFMLLHQNNYKVWLINEELKHLYNRMIKI